MITKVLIANRGEIACRVIRTARRMGVATVAVYSEADRDALHVELADEAVYIGPSPAEDSYLRGDRILAAAKETGAQAIHPGYGFLSENHEFCQMVTDAGLTFVGPSPQAIKAMGLKDSAKAIMEKAGVPVVPGYHGEDQDDGVLKKAADDIGYPVLIKAVAGGGGKGMRRIDEAGDFDHGLAAARSEALKAFGNDAVLIEKYIANPRHIEIQVFGDGSDALHLFERDCSLQRRHQKVIEEAPAPGMSEEMRQAMGDAAVRACRAIGYAGAGTVEFIVDASDGLQPDRFWFMEMNTRLQVEHPVTEAITGVDLVEWQLRIASGEGLPLTQDQLSISGHAIEARIYAEDPANAFLPAIGTVAHLKFADTCRADTGIRAGDRVSRFYDPMIAKIIVHAATRELALFELKRAVLGTEVAGIVTNLAFLANLVQQPDFVAGQPDTTLIDRNLQQLATESDPPESAIALAMLTASGLRPDANGFALWAPLVWRVEVRGQGLHSGLLTVPEMGRATIDIGTATFEFRHDGAGWTGATPGHGIRHGGKVTVFENGTWTFDIPEMDSSSAAVDSSDQILSPMPGLVRIVSATAGQSVTAGDPVAIVEAMKMEHTICAPRDGEIAEVFIAAGTQVDVGATLMRLKDVP